MTAGAPVSEDRAEPRTVLITGATDGLGLELARHWTLAGWRLVLVGRRPLEAVRGDPISPRNYCQVDLGRPDADLLVDRHLAARQITGLDLVLHNAAVGYYGRLEDQSPASISELIAVNLWAPIALTHRLLRRVEVARGEVAFVSSIAADLPCPEYAVYGATKSALDAFARSLAVESAGRFGVRVFHPGPIRTGFRRKMGVENRFDTARFPAPDRVAAAIGAALERRRTSARPVPLGRANAVLGWLGRYGAGWIDSWMRLKRRTSGAGKRGRACTR